jgi:hypothetical protein
MSLLIVYVVLVIAGDLVAYLFGLVIEREVPAASLPAFLAMYFLFLWVAWVVAVRDAAEGAASISFALSVTLPPLPLGCRNVPASTG